MTNNEYCDKPKLLIMYVQDGYMITDKEGCLMFFGDGVKTSGLKDKFEAMNICDAHGYDYEVV